MVGDIADDFVLKDQHGEEFRLYDNLDKNVLLVFYPKDSSPVCTIQLKNYWNNIEQFESRNIKIVPVNIEGAGSHSEFCENIGAGFRVLIDQKKEVSRKFGALNFFGMNKRKIVLIGREGKVLFEKVVFAAFYKNSDYIIRTLEKLKII